MAENALWKVENLDFRQGFAEGVIPTHERRAKMEFVIIVYIALLLVKAVYFDAK